MLTNTLHAQQFQNNTNNTSGIPLHTRKIGKNKYSMYILAGQPKAIYLNFCDIAGMLGIIITTPCSSNFTKKTRKFTEYRYMVIGKISNFQYTSTGHV